MREMRRTVAGAVAGTLALAGVVVGASPAGALTDHPVAGAPSLAVAGPTAAAPAAAAPAAAAPAPAEWDPFVMAPEGWSPAAESASFVIGVYRDLFDRYPDPEAGRWTLRILDGAPRGPIADALTSSAEYRSHLIADTYQRFLGRDPDGPGLAGWLRAMTSGLTIEQIQSGFIASDEYYAAAGGTPSAWVSQLYRDVLGRSAASSEVSAWVAALRRGESRSGVAMGFLLSTENLTTVVDGYYMDMLGRHIDPTGQRGWVRLIQQGARDEQIVAGIIASAEYWRTTAEAARIEVTPPVSTVRTGEPQTYRALAYDTSGTFIRDITYRTEFGTGGVLCDGPTCTVSEAGEHSVRAVSGWAGGSSTLRVLPASLHHLAVSPPTATVVSGRSVYYTAEAFDSAGNSLGDVTFATEFAVDGEEGSCTGAACAPVTVGTATVTASVLGASGTASVEVLEPGPPGSRLFAWEPYSYTDQYGLRSISASDIRQVEADTHWAQVDAGTEFALGVKTDGTLWGWGSNRLGQLGFLPDEAGDDVPFPTQLGTDRDWVSVSASATVGAALKSDGTLWTWGGMNTPPPTPLTSPPGPWVDIAACGGHWLAVHSDGSLWAWGWGTRGELGVPVAYTPTPVRVGTDNDWVAVDGGFSTSYGLRTDGSLWTWGFNSQGQLGLGAGVGTYVTTPTRVGTGTWTSVTAADSGAVAVSSDGSLWAWGQNYAAQLGDGTYEQRDTPTMIASAGSAPWVSADLGSSWGMGTRSDGTLWVWGAGSQPAWGPVPPERLRPRQIGTETIWRLVAFGGSHSDAGILLAD